MSADTIFALATGRPPAAVAIIRISGPLAHAAGRALAGELTEARHASVRTLRATDGSTLDEALLLRFDSPASFTGEDIVEFQCHGGRAVVAALLSELASMDGLREAVPGEFTRRALANGRLDLTEAEGLADLLAAETELQRRSALVRAGGALRKRLDHWREQLLALSARAEVAIDYSDEEDGAGDVRLGRAIRELGEDMAALAEAPRVEPLRDGIRVVVAGPPNAGKSSLVNALVQSERAIVTHIPGTTRDVIEVPISIDGVPFVLVDTAGLRDSDDVVEAIGIERARSEAESSDLLLWLGEPDEQPDHSAPIQLDPKSDLGTRHGRGLAVSAATGAGLQELTRLLVKKAQQLLPNGDELALDRRQHELLVEARKALARGADLIDLVLVAEELRVARAAIDRISGRAGVEELLDALFSRFCLGK